MKNTYRIQVIGALLIGLALAGSAMPFDASAQSFEDFKNAQQQTQKEKGPGAEQAEFEAYQQNVHDEFEQYKQIVAEEFKKYKQQILEKWEKAEVSTDKRWVEYSENYEDRRIVDFEQGFIELDLLVDEDETDTAIEKAVDQKLADLVVEDQKTAYERDQLAQNIEKQIKQKVKDVKTEEVQKEPVLTKVITGTDQPSKKQVNEAVSGLKEKSTVTKKPSGKDKTKQVVNVKAPLPPDSIRKKALEYQDEVTEFSGQRGVDPALVFAVIHTESAFNPMARSHVPAYGLMQIVPQSAGKDASAMLFGKPRLLSPSYLYNGQKNINVGTSYLYILFNRYLKKIESPKSRMYCAIAAYNTGAGNVAKAFTGTTNIGRAAGKINQMTPDAVYDHLIANLPYEETRHYLERVTRRMEMYAAM
ncbi:MAG: transglycosylase SLT domain-containing protein [Thermodesulfobacteriota bacterium]